MNRRRLLAGTEAAYAYGVSASAVDRRRLTTDVIGENVAPFGRSPQDKVDWLSPIRLGNWLRTVGYNHQTNLDKLWDHLHNAPRGTTGPQAAARAQITLAMVAALAALRGQIRLQHAGDARS